MTRETVTIWDGETFRQVTKPHASKLVKQGKAQIIDGLKGTDLLTKKEMTGYRTRAMSAKAKSAPLPFPEKDAPGDADVRPPF